MDVSLKDQFELAISVVRDPKYLVVAVLLPSKAIELIFNSQNLATKLQYYVDAYDQDFALKTNRDVQIISFMLV